jgi:DNA-(apurinic or apyrimidinic site) lyase
VFTGYDLSQGGYLYVAGWKTMRREKLVEIFNEIPWNVWERIVRKEPEWEHMESFLSLYSFGPFAVLMLTTGLNDYQLKGRAEIVYWPKIRKILAEFPPPKSINELRNMLMPFYQEERLKKNKIERLNRFLNSSLASKMWESSSQKVSNELPSIKDELAETMCQDPRAKTIAFAMKCLGISLLMAGEYGFDFSSIPIPVDSRVIKFTNQLGFHANTESNVRHLWHDILLLLQKQDSRITMIHLDSLVWQIAPMNKHKLQKYFRGLWVPRVGDQLCVLLQL